MEQMGEINKALEELYHLLPIGMVNIFSHILGIVVQLKGRGRRGRKREKGSLLNADCGFQVYHLDYKSLESELFRRKRSFGHKKDTLLATIQDKDEQLYKFLDSASQTRLLAESKGRARSSQFLILQRHALMLSGYFSRFWTCSYSSSHSCGVTIIQNETLGSKHLGLPF